MSDLPEGMRLSVSVSRKANLGNYQSADFFLSISNIEVGATEDEMREALVTGEIAFGVIKDAIDQKIAGLQQQKAELQQRPPAAQAPATQQNKPRTPVGETRETPAGFQPRR